MAVLTIMKKTSSPKTARQTTRRESKLDQILRIVKGHDKKFEAIDQRFDAVDQRFEAIDQRLGRIDHRLDRIEGNFEFYVRKEDFVVKKLDTLTQESASTHLALKRHDERFDKIEAFVGMAK